MTDIARHLEKSPSPQRTFGEAPPAPRPMGAVNWRGLWTLYLKEVRRFLKVFTQTVLAPMVTTLLFLAVFTLALGRRAEIVGVDFGAFLAPGLIMMAMAQNAFANTSSSLVSLLVSFARTLARAVALGLSASLCAQLCTSIRRSFHSSIGCCLTT